MPIDHLTAPRQVDDEARRGLTDCWVAVSNAGGAVGFAFPPVSRHDVAAAVDRLVSELDPRHCVVFRAGRSGDLDGWVVLRRGTSPLVSHWGTVERLQTAPKRRDLGVGRALLAAVDRYAWSTLGLVQLHLAARGGMGLENYYEQLGWREVGRWPSALRLAADDVRDEVLMQKRLRPE